MAEVPDDDVLMRCVDDAAALHGIPVDPAWREAALGNMRAVATAAAFVLAFPLEDEADLASVFRA